MNTDIIGTDVSARVVDQLATAAWQGGLALLIVWCLCNVWKNCAPRVRCWLWRIAFAKLLLATVWLSPWELAVLPAESPQPQAQRETDESASESVNMPYAAANNVAGNSNNFARNNSFKSAPAGSVFATPANAGDQNTNASATSATATPLVASQSTRPGYATSELETSELETVELEQAELAESAAGAGFPVKLALAGVWLVGVVVGLVILSRQQFIAWKLRRTSSGETSSALSDELVSLRGAIKRRLSLAHAPQVHYSPSVHGPMLIGFREPLVLLPQSWREDPQPELLRMALTHEFAHVRRRDLLWNWLPAVARIVFWFHPLVWIASRHWSLDVEEACDELAVNVGRLPRVRYAEFLVGIVARRHAGFAPMALGAASPFSHLKRRLLSMKKRNDKPGRLWLAMAGCGLLGLGILAPVQLTAQDAPPNPATQTAGTSQTGGVVTQRSNTSGGTVQSAGGGTGVVTQRSGGSGTTVQSAGGGGGIVSQSSGATGRSATSPAGGGGGVSVRSNQGSGTTVASAGRGDGKGKTTVSIAKDGKSISVEVEPSDDKVSVTVTRTEGENKTVNKYSLDSLDELKENDLEAYDTFKEHTQPVAGTIRGGAGRAVGAGQNVGGSVSRASGGGAGRGSNAEGSGGGSFGRASSGQSVGSGSGGGASRSGQNVTGASSFGRGSSGQSVAGSGTGSSANEGGSGSNQAGASGGRGSSRAGINSLLKQLNELREKNQDNPEVVKAIDELVQQLMGGRSSGR